MDKQLQLKESERLAALRALNILDTKSEQAFDALAAAAALVCATPVSLVSMVDKDRQWFKAVVGLPGERESPRGVAFCAYTIEEEDILEVTDTLLDPRFKNNPLVTDAPHIRFYAGVPLRLGNGAAVGSLCVVDHAPRQLTDTQRSVLKHLAVAVVQALESRRVAEDSVIAEAGFRALSEASPLGVFATDAMGSCQYTNSRWQAIFGIPEGEALGTGWSRTLHPDDKERVFEEWQATAIRQLPFDMGFRILRDNGEISHVRAISSPLLDDDGNFSCHVGSVEDVTRQYNADTALRRHQRLLAETSALADVGGWELDLSTSSLLWTEQTYRIHGLDFDYEPTVEAAIGFYSPEAQPGIRAAIDRCLDQGGSFDLELPLMQKGGELIWVRAVGHVEFDNDTPTRLLGALQVITERVEQRVALEVAHQRITIATDSGQIGVWEWRYHDANISWTPQTYRLFGLPPSNETIELDRWIEHVHPTDRARVRDAMQGAMSGTCVLDIEYRIVWEDGSVRHLHTRAQLTRDNHGRAIRLLGVNLDVTRLRGLSLELAEQRELLQVTLQSIADGVITTDSAGCITWMNPVAERMTGWSSDAAAQKPLAHVFKIINEETRRPAINPVTTCLAKNKVVGLANDTVLVSKGGEEFAIEDSAAPITNGQDEVLGVVLVFHDVSEQRKMSVEMSFRAAHDILTGLVNRQEFEIRLNSILSDAKTTSKSCSLLYIDLDQFKLVNDACGHSVGDQLLQQVSNLLADTVRSGDTLARIGGDEFAVILDSCSFSQAELVAQEICDRLDDFRFEHDGRRFRIGASIGIVPIDARWSSIAAAMQAADVSCYAAKEAGRNRVHAWFDTDKSMQARSKETQWASRLEQALDEDRFELFAQRIEAASDENQELHAEALIRLRDESGKLIQPNAFLPAAERFHLATHIDRWVMLKTIDLMHQLPETSRLKLLSLNLSGQSIGDREFHRVAIDALERAGKEICHRLCLEITETTAITNIADAQVFIEQARSLGVRIALDDFGAGASSFGYLKTLAVDSLKIDGQFIRNLVDDPLDTATVRCFVDVARAIGVKTVAEYVDRPEILARVKEIGVDYWQGYLLHKPEPISNVLELSAVPG